MNREEKEVTERMRVRIPKRVTNRRMLKIMKGLRIAGNLIPILYGKRVVRKHLKENTDAFRSHRFKVLKDGGFIEHQYSFGDMRYGYASVRHSGCEVIAVYNVLHALTGKQPNLAKLIAAFENNGMILYGSLGTDPGEMKSFLRKRGFSVEEYMRPEDFPGMQTPGSSIKGDAYVLTFYNDRHDLLQGIHTVAVTEEGGMLYSHNDGGAKAGGPYADIAAVLRGYDARGTGMISILHVSAG